MQVIRAEGDVLRAVEVVVSIAVKGAAEASCVAVVDTRRTDGQAHPPITNIGPDEGPGWKDQLQEESRH